MACLRIGYALILSLLLPMAVVLAQEQPPGAMPGLYDRPVLVIDPGMHTAVIRRASADIAGRWAVTGSDDKTVRVWLLADGTLQRTIRLPAGPGDVGKVYAVAMSPDGALIAAGGSTGPNGQPKALYLLDRATGTLVRRIEGSPDAFVHLAFSPDGRFLAATLYSGGLRIYAHELSWAEVARDEAYGDQSYGADFAPDGRLATTGWDGKVRLALGYDDSTAVDLLDGRTLTPLPRPDLGGVDNGRLGSVAWSRDSRILFAAGQYLADGGCPVFAWSNGGTGTRRTLPAGQDAVTNLIPLPAGDLLIASADPWLARLRPDGTARWAHGPPKADFPGQFDTLSVSSDGTLIDFGFALLGKEPARFDLVSHALTLDPPANKRTAIPRQDGLPIDAWFNTTHPTLDGRVLQLDPYEKSFSLAISPIGDRFVLGAAWTLRAFDAKGMPLWTRRTPGVVWAVNITGDGRLVVAAYGDGTIRWHRLSDGVELLAFMPLPDKTDWVAWTPEGFYAATAGAQGILRWHVNHGWDAPADSVAVEDIPGSYRPAVLPLVLQELETPRALGLAVLAEHDHEIMLRTNSRLPPGIKLQLLTIGIDAYNEDYAKNLRLHYADRDARGLASAIVNTQGSLYAAVELQVLLDKDANKAGIMRALETMRENMAKGEGNDVAVIHFSGHGALVDGSLYLLPADVDARDPVGIETSGLRADQFRDKLLDLAKYGRVLVLLDACHSGATTMNGAALAMDSTALGKELASANVTVLTSSSGSQVSREDDKWQHGAFTKALLDAFNDPAADINRNRLISPTGLGNYVTTRVESLTGGAQTPGMEIRYDTTVFAAGM